MLTEQEALAVLERSPLAHSLALGVERAQAEAQGVGLWPNPEIFLSREESASTTDQFVAPAQALPVTGRLGLLHSAAETEAAAVAVRARAGLLALRADLRTAFCDLLEAQEASAATEQAKERLGELVRILGVREEAGEASGLDRMRAERERAEVEADLVDARLREHRAGRVLVGLLALDEVTELVARGDLDESRELPAFEALLSRARARGDLAALERERESASLRTGAASRLSIPEPALLAGSKKTETPVASGQGPVVSLTIPIPVFNRGQHARALAQAEEKLARSRHEAQLRLARAEIDSAYQEVIRRQEAKAGYRSASDPEELVRTARIAYDEGEQGILELLDAYRTALAVWLRGLKLTAAARKAYIVLDRAVGEEVSR